MADVNNPNLFSIWQAWCVRYRDHQRILDDLFRVYECAPDSFGARLLKIQNDGSLLQGALADHSMQCASFPREALAWGWRVTSFSGLMAHVGHTKLITKTKDDSDVSDSLDEATLSAEINLINEVEIIPSAEPILSVFNYPLREIPASEAGTCVHTILERWFEETPSELDSLVLMEQIICGVMSEVGLSDRWLPVLISMLSHTIYSIMPPLSCALADILPASRLSEMEFTFPLNAFSAGSFRSVLRHADYGLPAIFYDAMDQWSFRDISGFMRGYIDLIVEVDEKYFVIDYKTNYLGDSMESYNDSAMSAAIAQHHYYVQYVLYCVAVHRHLRQRMVGYNYNLHFGGVLYLFVRGLGGAGEHGIYFYRPSWDLICALDQLF
jgi:exodeoxyribonuclease V beta subunit